MGWLCNLFVWHWPCLVAHCRRPRLGPCPGMFSVGVVGLVVLLAMIYCVAWLDRFLLVRVVHAALLLNKNSTALSVLAGWARNCPIFDDLTRLCSLHLLVLCSLKFIEGFGFHLLSSSHQVLHFIIIILGIASTSQEVRKGAMGCPHKTHVWQNARTNRSVGRSFPSLPKTAAIYLI